MNEMQATTGITTALLGSEGSPEDRLRKFYPDHLQLWAYAESERIKQLRTWVAEAAMDAAGLPVGQKHWTLIEARNGIR